MSAKGSNGFGPRAAEAKKGGAKKKKKGDGDGDGDGDERVNVVVRVRPQLHSSEGRADNMSLQVDATRDMVWAMPSDDDGSGRGKLPRQFVFDRVIPPEGRQEDVYTSAAQNIVGSVLEGFTGCVMCYGQTGAGKTYTLANESAGPNAGVMLRAFTEIFEHIAQDTEHEYEVTMSYCQVYLDNLSDLLTPRNDVQIREDADKGVFLTGLTWRSCKTVRDAKSVLADGNRNRATAATSMNQDSSRSHAVLQMHISRRGGARTLLGKLYLVDLAGSERVKKSGVEGAAMDEAIAINQSLTILGRCIEAMARGKKGERPPFRESKLTRLLSNAIGGAAKTTLIVCVAPSRRDVVETNSSLEFGQQAMNVIVRAKVNATVDYGGLNAQLQEQLDAKQAALRRLEHKVLTRLSTGHQSVLLLERQVKERTYEVKEANVKAQKAKAELTALSAGKGVGKETELARKALALERTERTAELARVMALLKDTPELRRIRDRQERDIGSLRQQLINAQAELEVENSSSLARGGTEVEQELLVGVARNLGNLALHFVGADARSQAEPLIVSAQSIFEAVLGPGHPQIGEWKTHMFEKIAEQNEGRNADSSGGGDGGGGGGGGGGGFPVVRFLAAFATPRHESRNVPEAVDEIITLLGSFTNPRPPAHAGDLSLDLSNLKMQEPETAETRRTARQHVLDVLAQPLREGDGPKEQKALEAVRHFFIEHGNGVEAIVHFHRLVYSARSGGYNAVDKQQAYGNNYNPQFVQHLEQTFTARGSARGNEEKLANSRKEEARSKLLRVAGTPRGGHLSASTPRNENAAEAALANFMNAYDDPGEAIKALQELIHGTAASSATDAQQDRHDKEDELRRIMAGEDADEERANQRLQAAAQLLHVASSPRGGRPGQQAGEEDGAEVAIADFIEAFGLGSDDFFDMANLAEQMNQIALSARGPPPPRSAPPRPRANARLKEEARSKLLRVAGTPRGLHLSASTPRNENAAEAALRDFMNAYGDGEEALEALQSLMSHKPAPSDARYSGAEGQTRLQATAKLLEVASTPRGGNLPPGTPRDGSELALADFIDSFGLSSDEIADMESALQQLMAASGGNDDGLSASAATRAAPAARAPSPAERRKPSSSGAGEKKKSRTSSPLARPGRPASSSLPKGQLSARR